MAVSWCTVAEIHWYILYLNFAETDIVMLNLDVALKYVHFQIMISILSIVCSESSARSFIYCHICVISQPFLSLHLWVSKIDCVPFCVPIHDPQWIRSKSVFGSEKFFNFSSNEAWEKGPWESVTRPAKAQDFLMQIYTELLWDVQLYVFLNRFHFLPTDSSKIPHRGFILVAGFLLNKTASFMNAAEHCRHNSSQKIPRREGEPLALSMYTLKILSKCVSVGTHHLVIMVRNKASSRYRFRTQQIPEKRRRVPTGWIHFVFLAYFALLRHVQGSGVRCDLFARTRNRYTTAQNHW